MKIFHTRKNEIHDYKKIERQPTGAFKITTRVMYYESN